MLTAEDRQLFTLVSEAAFANPFGDTRARLDRSLAPKAGTASQALSRRLAKLRPYGLAKLSLTDRRLLEDAILFDIFHGTAERFDALIAEQRAAGDRPVPVPFARDFMKALTDAGFSEPDAARYFALFFQLRRAFVFIGESLPGASTSMRRFREHLWNNLFTVDARLYARSLWRRMEDFSTFVVGETGTGKGTAAAAIGRAAFIPFDGKAERFVASFEKGFVSINLSQFPESLIESELFGHTRGAFTGATSAHEGVFARCSAHGAIFLDEIGEATPPVQIKLLRVLQERTFSPVGGHEVLRFSGRVVAATNRPLVELRGGSFRDDFYYRLCSDVIVVPPLRDRLAEEPSELRGLVTVILGRIVGGSSDKEELSERVLRAVASDVGSEYRWPGNVRELEQCVRRVLLTGHYEGEASKPVADADRQLLDVVGDASMKALTARYCKALYARHDSYEEVARRVGLDRRTVKAYVDA